MSDLDPSQPRPKASRESSRSMRLKRSPFRFTIERIRTLVLVCGVVLVAAIVGFLVFGQWRRHFLKVDLPKRLGADIELQADSFDYTQTSKGKTIFKIHAARAVQLKLSGKALLHDVRIDLYGEDGSRTDTISGAEFEYDKDAGIAQAVGPVEITMMRPGVAPAVASLRPGAKPEAKPATKPGSAQKMPALVGAVTDGQIHVKTSGLRFDQKSGVATTAERVDFALKQGSGNSIGASYNSNQGALVLDRAVELGVDRAGGPVTVHAAHAEFERGQQTCALTQAHSEYTGGTADLTRALLHFRDDGSVERLDGSDGVDLRTLTGSHITAPAGTLDFDAENHPRHGVLQGGARIESSRAGRQMRGSAPTANLDFDGGGRLQKAHMESGVLFESRSQTTTGKGPAEAHRTWKSQTADISFETVGGPSSGIAGKGHGGQLEPSVIVGHGGVVVTSETTGAGASAAPAKLMADSLVGTFAPGAQLSKLDGVGHTSFEQVNAQGAHQSSSSDQLSVKFLTGPAQGTGKGADRAGGAGAEIESVEQLGNVVLVQEPAAKGDGGPPPAPVRAWATRLDYDGAGEWMHLAGVPGTPPRVRNGALEMTATRIDFARATGDAFGHGDVRASWSVSNTPGSGDSLGSSPPGATLLGSGGNEGPAHAIAAEAELHQKSGEIVFRAAPGPGSAARLWRAGNSVTAPLIVLNRLKQTLTAETESAANPVHTVLVSNSPASGDRPAAGTARPREPNLIGVKSGELHYSDGERVATFTSGRLGSVTMESNQTGGVATVVSDEAVITLLPAGVHSAPGGGAAGVDRMVSQGHVTANWPGRKGTGAKLVYTGDDGNYTLTGSSAAPPRITDQTRGTVTGSALIFHSRDDSVTIEGDGRKTVTETRSPK